MHHIVFLDRDSLRADVRAPNFPHRWQDHAATSEHQVVERLQGATIAISNKVPITAQALEQLPDLRFVAIAATGTNNVDLDACRARGIAVANIRDYSRVSVPEHCMMLMLALRRNLRAYIEDVEAGLWERSPHFCLFGKPIGDLAGSRLGIVGFGTLGRQVAALGRAFGMQILAHSRSPIAQEGVTQVDLDTLLRSADVVSLHLPLLESTRHMIGERELAMMQPHALLINTARGALVDEQALATALTEGRIAGAAVDGVSTEPPPPDHPLLQLRLPNFIVTPHVAWASSGAMQTLADMLVDNIEAWQAGTPRNLV